MKVLIIGSGGREHALVWKIRQSEKVKQIYVAPGNGGTANLAKNIDIQAEDIDKLLEFALKEKIDLTIVGPEKPLVLGIVDEFKKRNLKIFGPSKKAAQLEGSKVFAKKLMAKYGIPTAEFEIFDNCDRAVKFIEKKNSPLVIKADGLAQGKGVVICDGKEDAKEAAVDIMVNKKFGDAGGKIVVEEKLTGEEASIIALSDGRNILALASSQDHKQIYDGDRGENTGGMGAYSPAPVADKKVFDYSINEIIKKTVAAMQKEDLLFSGVLYAGIMVTKDGPKVLEFNVRFGDPETQAILPRMESDLVDSILAAAEGKLDGKELSWSPKSCVCVVAASGGYPGGYEKNKFIEGLKEAEVLEDVIIFHAGTEQCPNPGQKDKKFKTTGGRVLGVTGQGRDIKEAIERAYSAIKLISFEKIYYRRDIGFKALR